MLEKYGFYLLLVAAALALVGYVWLLSIGFKERTRWGVGMLLFPPASLIFLLGRFRRCAGPLLLFLTAGFIAAAALGLGYYEGRHRTFGPHEETVGGELRITLTGADVRDYPALQTRREVVVLQMANDDVNDQTLEYLRGLDRLRRLDLRGTQITDDGLRVLAELPQLQELFLARTKITDEGFRTYLAPKESLRKVDLTGTEVKTKTLREWKNAKPEERDYVN
jgi:hypothetical protein